MVAFAPLAYFLQSTPQKPPLMLEKDKLEEQLAVVDSKNIAREKQEIIEDYSAPDIKTAIVEALSSPAFILVTLGFSVCGFHVAFLMTHFPAYLQGQGINSSLAAWTISIIGLGSMIGTIIAGYLSSIIEPRFVLMGIFFVRAILIIIMVFIPLSVTTTVVFSVLFGPVLLSTVPVTTKFIGDVFGQKYLGTLISLATVGHQIASFLGAYVAGVVYDRMHDYTRIWYGCLAASILAIVVNFFAGFDPIAKRQPNLKHS
jgi:predicted MFS family arabinose efflux permease